MTELADHAANLQTPPANRARSRFSPSVRDSPPPRGETAAADRDNRPACSRAVSGERPHGANVPDAWRRDSGNTKRAHQFAHVALASRRIEQQLPHPNIISRHPEHARSARINQLLQSPADFRFAKDSL